MIYIIRHGQTEKNRVKVLQGRSDVPLNDAGRQQAMEARDRFAARGIHFDKVYTSPLLRAVQTAEIIAEGIPQAVDKRLIDMDYGPYEGISSWKTWEFLQRTDMIPEYRKKSWKKSVSSEQA